ncbi:MAG: hypothetical protein F4X64_15655 [Chloroflexi bacterium]|nr:hypothetical protein [Chloroflexota bacterium]
MTTTDNENREPPFSQEELAELWPFDVPWPFNDDDGVEDEEELDMLRSLERGEWRSVPNLEEEMERARQMARNTMATWSEEKLAEVRQRVEAKNNGVWKPPAPLAGDSVSDDNSHQSENT